MGTGMRVQPHKGARRMAEITIDLLLHLFWPSALAVFVVACASISTWSRRPGRMAALSLALAGTLVVPYGWMIFGLATEPHSNILVRDIVGLLILGPAAPLIAASTAALVRRITRGWTVGAAAMLVGMAWVLSSPLLLLAVHCSSGDCL